MSKTLVNCDCLGTQKIDPEGLSKATGLDVRAPCTALCAGQIDLAAKALQQGDVVICCLQEARRFEALAEELQVDAPPFLDLRDRAGWSRDGASKLPKMAALVADMQVGSEPDKTLDVVSEGLCLVIGPARLALDAAEQLKEHLSVTVLLADSDDVPDTRDFDVITGRLRRASGAFGQFRVVIDGLRQIVPGGRGSFALTEPRDGGQSNCDIVLDLSGQPPLFPAHEKRDGYLRADPAHPPSVAAAVMAASHMVGTFEKTLHVATQPMLCAHSRAEQTGCTRCIDLCPTGAIRPDGEHVAVDPMICAGCGACSAVCPSGAIAFDAPPVEVAFRRVQAMARAYLGAGGAAPRLLVVDGAGADMIRAAARHGDGLPADVVPMEVSALNSFGHAEIVAALAAGFASVALLPGPKADRAALESQVALAGALAGEGLVRLVDTPDPEVLTAELYDETPPAPVATPVRPAGTRRQITRSAAKALNPGGNVLPLPEGAPYGAVLVDTDACTLCLSCVSLCPSGALGDNPDKPQLRFQEDACLQCGICASVCPEDAIAYEPRLNLADGALSQVVLNEEEPFACVECGALFGSRSAIEKITERLRGHSMYADPERLKMIQMCDDCRVNAQYHSKDNPFAAGERPKPRTTDDYLSKRRDH